MRISPTQYAMYVFTRPFANHANGSVNGALLAIGFYARRSVNSNNGEFQAYLFGGGHYLLPMMSLIGGVIGFSNSYYRNQNEMTPDKLDLMAFVLCLGVNLMNFCSAISGAANLPVFGAS